MNIIFDLAGVVLNLDLERDTKALRSVGLPDFFDFPNHPQICNPTMDYLNGLSTPEKLCNSIRQYCKEGVTDEQILWSMDEVLDTIPKERLLLIKELRKKYRVFLLSNIYDTAWQYTLNEMERNGMTPDDCFEKTFLSYEMQLAKPDPRIFQAVIDDTGIIPEETFYFDDSRHNIEAGKKMGFKAVLVEMNKLEDALKECGITE